MALARPILILSGLLFLFAFSHHRVLVLADDEEQPVEKTEDNPFLPREGLTVEELREFIDRMQQSPKTIQQQPGFSEALLVAVERILSSQPEEESRAFALVTRLDALHKKAVYDDDESQKKLTELARQLKTDSDKAVARAAEFYLLEGRAIDGSRNAKTEELPALLADLKKSLSAGPLDARHLRICSATVRIINRLADDELAAKSYKEFGALWSASENDELAKYGRKIAQGVRAKAPEMVGKPMPLAGKTPDGKSFDIAQYKGKVVLIDFWATWCGPCRAALPELKELYEQYHAKGFEIVGVSVDSDKQALIDLIAAEEIPWTNLHDADESDPELHPLADKYGVRGLPTTFLIDREGKVIARDLGGAALSDKVEQALTPAVPEEKKSEPEKATEKPAADKPADEKPAADKPADSPPPADGK